VLDFGQVRHIHTEQLHTLTLAHLARTRVFGFSLDCRSIGTNLIPRHKHFNLDNFSKGRLASLHGLQPFTFGPVGWGGQGEPKLPRNQPNFPFTGPGPFWEALQGLGPWGPLGAIKHSHLFPNTGEPFTEAKTFFHLIHLHSGCTHNFQFPHGAPISPTTGVLTHKRPGGILGQVPFGGPRQGIRTHTNRVFTTHGNKNPRKNFTPLGNFFQGFLQFLPLGSLHHRGLRKNFGGLKPKGLIRWVHPFGSPLFGRKTTFQS